MTEAISDSITTNGMEVEVWAVFTNAVTQNLTEWGVTGITVDGLNVSQILTDQYI